MDRDTLVQHLSTAEKHVTQGMKHVERQRERVRELERKGRDTNRSRALLREFEGMLALHIQDRDRIRSELAHSGEVL